jgi:NTE family protein
MRLQSAALVASGLFALHATAAPPQEPPPPAGIGLVLGGGGARGLAHIGVIQELEKLRIPIACIAGTSAGALVGGVYASGMSSRQLEKEVETADWVRLLAGTPRRADVPYENKRDDVRNLADLTLGISRTGGLRVPRAAVGSQEIDSFLRRMTRDISVPDFETLPIPFEAVATDLASGEAHVFKGGDLAIALRSSMAVPGIFDLVTVDGHPLVDGMLVRNVPVQNVKNRCAEKLIVVDVGTPLLPDDEIHNLIDVAQQQQNILVRNNVLEQLALMTPGDVLIQPDLTGIATSDFEKAPEIIKRGRAAVAPLADELAEFSLDEAAYAQWKAVVAARQPAEAGDYADVRIGKTKYVPPAELAAYLGIEKEKPKNQKELLESLNRLYATGDFDRVGYVLRDENGLRVADVLPVERSVGPNYLRLGLDFKVDTYNTADIAFLANLRMTWLNEWGAQWRNDVRLGKSPRLQSELIQPLARTPFFLSLGGLLSREQFNFYDDTQRFAVANQDIGAVEADLGLSFGRYGELRVGYFRAHDEISMDIGPKIDPIRANFGGVAARLVVDQLDNPRFPRHGYYVALDGRYVFSSAQDDFVTIRNAVDLAYSLGNTTLRGSFRFEGALEGSTNETGSIHSLGGFLRLSGFQDGEFVGSRTMLARAMVYHRLIGLLPNFGSGVYLGGSAEAGRVWEPLFISDLSGRTIYSGSVFGGVDTLLGPLYLAYGQGIGGRRAGYLYLGVDY